MLSVEDGAVTLTRDETELAPDSLTLRGAFDRHTVDSGLKSALTLHFEEHSSIAHAELLGTVTLESAGTVDKLSAAETAFISGSNLPENTLTAENSEAAMEAAAKDFLQEAAKAVALHLENNGQAYVIMIAAGDDEAVSAKSAEAEALPDLPAEEETGSRCSHPAFLRAHERCARQAQQALLRALCVQGRRPRLCRVRKFEPLCVR